MKKFEVALLQTLVEYVDIEAENAKEAEDKAWTMIHEDVTLEFDMVKGFDVDVIGEVADRGSGS